MDDIRTNDDARCKAVKHPIRLGDAELRVWERDKIPSHIKRRFAGRLFINGKEVTRSSSFWSFSSIAEIINLSVKFLNTWREIRR